MSESSVAEVSGSPESVVVSVKNLGPIVDCEIPIVPGSVTVLCGANGVGKTTAQKALTGVLTKSASEISPRDGVDAGSVEMPGVKVRIGKRMTVKGDPAETFVIIEDGDELRQFIDPGIAKAASADAKRIEALLRMANVSIPESVFAEFCGEADWSEFRAAVDSSKDGPVEIVAKLKRWMDSRARTAEVEVEQATGAIAQIGEIPPEPKSINKQELMNRQSDLHTSIASAVEAIRASRAAQKSLDELVVVNGNVEEMESQIEVLKEALIDMKSSVRQVESDRDANVDSLMKERDAELERIRREFDARIQTERQLHETKIANTNADIATASSRIESLTADKNRIVTFSETAARLRKQAATDWTDEQVESMRSEVARIATSLQDAAVAEASAKDRQKKVESLQYQQRKKAAAEERAKKFRELAHQTPKILSDAVKNLPGWSIMNHEGEIRLMCQHRRGMICFDQLSPGEAVARGLEVKCQPREFRGRIPVASVDAELWAALDADAQQHVFEHIATAGIALVTSRCSGPGESRSLHAVVMSKSDAEN